MKKSIFFVAALLLSSMAFAELENLTIDIAADTLASKYSWSNGKAYLSAKLDGNITVRVDTTYTEAGAVSSNQSGVYYIGTPGDWRIYQARVDSFFFEADNGALIDSVQLTYTDGGKKGTLSTIKGINVGAAYRIASDSVLNVGGVAKVCLYAASTADGVTNGQVRISRFRIFYRGKQQKQDPTFKFESTEVSQKLSAATYTNTLINTSNGTVTYESSVPSIATVDNNGLVTFVGEGETTITASVTATEQFNAATASYTLTLRADNWNMETFKGAQFAGTGTYYTEPTTSANPSEATGLKWTAFLGSVKSGLGNFDDIAAVIRQRKSTESEYKPGYLVSDSIAGGIDSLAFRWNANGTESGYWNIAIYINNDSIAAVQDAAGAQVAKGEQPTFSIGGLKREGKFVLRFVNMAPVSDGTGNTKRFCIDNIEWYSYSTTPATGCEEAKHEAAKPVKVVKDGMLYIYKDGQYINVLGF